MSQDGSWQDDPIALPPMTEEAAARLEQSEEGTE